MTCVIKIVTPSLKTGKGDLANQMSLGKIHCQRTLLFPLHVKVCEIDFGAKFREMAVKEASVDLSPSVFMAVGAIKQSLSSN